MVAGGGKKEGDRDKKWQMRLLSKGVAWTHLLDETNSSHSLDGYVT